MRSLGIWMAIGMAACGGGKGGGLGLAEALDQNLETVCSRAHECRAEFPTDQGFMFEDVFEANVDACVANFQQNSQSAEIIASVDAGRIIYRPNDFAACSSFLDDLSCTEFWGAIFDMNPPQPASCDRSLEGTVELGGQCTIDLDCTGEARCTGDGMGGMTCI